MAIIHLVLGKANPDRMNGVNHVAHQLATHQVALGAAVEIWGITPTPELGVQNRTYKVKLYRSHLNKFRLDGELKKAFSQLGASDLVHLHGGFIPDFYPVAKQLQKLGIRYVMTPHGNYMKGAMQKSTFLKKWYFKGIEKKLLQNAAFVHCIGRGEVSDLQKLDAFEKIQLIPNGQDFGSFRFARQELPKMGKPVFGFCGRITRFQKGLDLLLEGFRIYKHNYDGKGVLWLIGEGDYFEDILTFVEKNQLSSQVKLYGSRFGEEKLNIMANMDVFFHPSRNEGLPMAVLEAAALSKPLVVSEFTNMTEYVSEYDAGICLEHNTPNCIAQSMVQMEEWKRSGKCEFLGQNARKMAEENFDWKQIAQKMLNVYATDITIAVAG